MVIDLYDSKAPHKPTNWPPISYLQIRAPIISDSSVDQQSSNALRSRLTRVQLAEYLVSITDRQTCMQDDMITAIYGSNAIESVGSSLAITSHFCKLIFRGHTPNIKALIEDTTLRVNELAYLNNARRKTHWESIIRSRTEIVQHTYAMLHLFDKLVTEGANISEQLINDTHRILMLGSDHEQIGGVYRTGDEAASHGLRPETDEEYSARVRDSRRLKPDRAPDARKIVPLFFSKFVRGPSVPLYMARFVQEFNKEMRKLTMGKCSFDVTAEAAARLCTLFVCIHPFEDGNGRMCRLIMNVVLLKYRGLCVAIGAEKGEGERYIEMACKANKVFTKEDKEDVPWDELTCHCGLASMVLKKMRHGRERRLGMLPLGVVSNSPPESLVSG